MRRYVVVAWLRRPCAECDELDAGEYNRLDHGCVWEEDLAETDSLPVARMAAGRTAKRPDASSVAVRDREDPDERIVWTT